MSPKELYIDPRTTLVADILLRACEGPNAQLRPWRPFDLFHVSRTILAALDAERKSKKPVAPRAKGNLI